MKLKNLLLAGFLAAFSMHAFAQDSNNYYVKFVMFLDENGDTIDNTIVANQIPFEGMHANETKTISVLVFHDPSLQFRDTDISMRLKGSGIKFAKHIMKGKRMKDSFYYDADNDETVYYSLTTAWQPKGNEPGYAEERAKHYWDRGLGILMAMQTMSGESGQEMCRLAITTDETWNENSTAQLQYEIALSKIDASGFEQIGQLDAEGYHIKGLPSAVNDVNASKEISNVKYYNVAGVESAEPFQGINIVVTTYADGSKTTNKVVK